MDVTHPAPDDGDIVHRRLGDKAKRALQDTQQHGDIKVALVIAHDKAAAFGQVFKTGHRNLCSGQPAQGFCPKEDECIDNFLHAPLFSFGLQQTQINQHGNGEQEKKD